MEPQDQQKALILVEEIEQQIADIEKADAAEARRKSGVFRGAADRLFG